MAGSRAWLAAALVPGPLLFALGGATLRLAPSPKSAELWWNAHLLLLAGAVLLTPAALALRGRGGGWPGAMLMILGSFALAGQMVIDLTVGLLAGTAARGPFFAPIEASRVMVLAFYGVGPALAFIGMILLSIELLRRRAAPPAGPVLVIAGAAIVGLARAADMPPAVSAGEVAVLLGVGAIAATAR